jgi:phage terminase large subunit
MMDANFPAPLECLFKPKRYKILWGGRGAGRSWGVARALLIQGTERPRRNLCGRELQNSIDESVHRVLSDQVMALNMADFYKVERNHIYGKNGTSFSYEGIKNNTNKIKSYEGIDTFWAEEANKMSRGSWGIVIPTIRKEGSEIWATFNPELDTDYTYTRFVKETGASASRPFVETDEAFIVRMTWRDNPWFPQVLKEEMERDKARDYDYYLNVWEGHCLQMLEGAVYAKELRKAQEEGRICSVPYSKEVPVDTFWDLGRADQTAIWFAQRVGMQHRILGYYSNSAFDITHYLQECQRRGYVYGTFFLPHDAKAKQLGTKLTVEEVIRAHGFKTIVVPRISPTDGINAARMVFSNCWFDEDQCEEGLNALRHYRYRVVEGQLSNEPLHDWASDGADAFRTLAVGLKERRQKVDVGERLKMAAETVLRKRGSDFADTRRAAGTRLGWMR